RPRSVVPSCLILDVTLPDLNGLELQERVASERPDMPIIFLTGIADVAMTVRAMKRGALEFLTKPFDAEALLIGIQQAIKRSEAALGRENQLHALRTDYGSLTQREREVMTLVVSGLLNKQVGGELGISEITVKAHRGNVMRKMKADSFVHLVNMASRLRVRYLPQVSLRSANTLLDSDRMIPPAMRHVAASGKASLIPTQQFAHSARRTDGSFTAN